MKYSGAVLPAIYIQTERRAEICRSAGEKWQFFQGESAFAEFLGAGAALDNGM